MWWWWWAFLGGGLGCRVVVVGAAQGLSFPLRQEVEPLSLSAVHIKQLKREYVFRKTENRRKAPKSSQGKCLLSKGWGYLFF